MSFENSIIKPQKTKILNYINVFRGLAILLIIMGHTMQFGKNDSLAHIVNCEIICGGTALFIFISGFLFQHLSYKYEFKNYMKKKWTNVVMPYLITSIPGLVFCLYCPAAYKNAFMGLNPFIQVLALLTIGRVHNIPTWFIPMIVIFFIFSWVFIKLEKKGVLYKFLLLLFFVHWYWFFIYNQIFHLPTVAPLVNGDYILTFGIIFARFFVVALVSLISLFIVKTILLKIDKDVNTRKFLGL